MRGKSADLDLEGGIEKGFVAIDATSRDFAKLGLFVANNGNVGDEKVVLAERTKERDEDPDWNDEADESPADRNSTAI
ncbi:MAG: hypothetical protein GX678_08225 [Actinomycetales bacterium]|nr:hypothetical protein [Actinomycetales bacterium]